MNDCHQTLTKLKAGLEHIYEAERLWSSGPFSYYIEKASDIIDEFFKRCCPVKVGDIVEITTEIDFIKCFGWAPWKEHLQPGKLLRVKGDVDFYKGQINFLVSPVSSDEAVASKLFCFTESMCRVIDPSKHLDVIKEPLIDPKPGHYYHNPREEKYHRVVYIGQGRQGYYFEDLDDKQLLITTSLRGYEQLFVGKE